GTQGGRGLTPRLVLGIIDPEVLVEGLHLSSSRPFQLVTGAGVLISGIGHGSALHDGRGHVMAARVAVAELPKVSHLVPDELRSKPIELRTAQRVAVAIPGKRAVGQADY